MIRNLLKILKSVAGTIGVQLKYGWIRDEGVVVTMGASVILKNQSGRIVTIDASGNALLTTASDTTIFGAIEDAAQTTSSTAGATKCNCITKVGAIYRVPITSGTYARATHRGKKLDLTVTSGQQGMALSTSTRGHVIVLDGDETSATAWVDVMINPALLGK